MNQFGKNNIGDNVMIESVDESISTGAATTKLECENNCHRRHFGTVWESSGVIDDGTGQGIVYAHREAAIKLLDIPRDQAKMIEEAAFASDEGRIAYDPRLPLSDEIKVSLKGARIEFMRKQKAKGAANPRRPRRRQQQFDTAEFFDNMTHLGDWLLYKHCRLIQPNVEKERDFILR